MQINHSPRNFVINLFTLCTSHHFGPHLYPRAIALTVVKFFALGGNYLAAIVSMGKGTMRLDGAIAWPSGTVQFDEIDRAKGIDLSQYFSVVGNFALDTNRSGRYRFITAVPRTD